MTSTLVRDRTSLPSTHGSRSRLPQVLITAVVQTRLEPSIPVLNRLAYAPSGPNSVNFHAQLESPAVVF